MLNSARMSALPLYADSGAWVLIRFLGQWLNGQGSVGPTPAQRQSLNCAPRIRTEPIGRDCDVTPGAVAGVADDSTILHANRLRSDLNGAAHGCG